MSNLNTLSRLLAATGAGLALCAVALPAGAQQAQAAPAQQAAPAADAQTISRDGTTGQLRPATPAEQAQLHALKTARQAQARIAPQPTQQKYHANGARGLRLTDQFLTSSTAVRTPDGKIEIREAQGGAEPAAPQVHATPAPAPVTE